ncbi:MAG: FtsQ-type POTRA domain-containing protein [bacterium]|nr:FtsQ-type POTRA domain-containing protein [bacterium]
MPSRERKGRIPGGHAVRNEAPVSRRGVWLKFLVVVFGICLISGGAVYALRSDYFSIVRVESGAYRFTDKEQLDTLLGGYLGHNIWTVSEDQVTKGFESLHWVKDLTISKTLPGTIEIDFREWRPLLSLDKQSDSGLPLVVVEDGRVLEFPSHLPVASLPVLVGVVCETDTLDAALKLENKWSHSVLDLLSAMAETGLETVCPVDFLVARSEGFAIVLQEGRGQLLVGKTDFSQRLARYMAARDHLEPGLQMDLRFEDKITCSRL